jgi:hypothetical protein
MMVIMDMMNLVADNENNNEKYNRIFFPFFFSFFRSIPHILTEFHFPFNINKKFLFKKKKKCETFSNLKTKQKKCPSENVGLVSKVNPRVPI